MKGRPTLLICWWLMSAQHLEVASAAFASRQPSALAFQAQQSRTDPHQTSVRPRRRSIEIRSPPGRVRSGRDTTSLNLSPDDQALAVWVASFASTHIGMSAVRSTIIEKLGAAADSAGLVGNGWRLPGWWPSDNSGPLIFPDGTAAGRQFYRALYTAVSFFTLGSALAAYLESSRTCPPTIQPPGDHGILDAYLLGASFSFGAAIASLFNASPLGLMPGFEGADDDGGAMLRRDDAKKFAARGLTRITRHPLLLPVVPWGLCTVPLTGGRPCDYVLFGGLSAYTILGCYAQDLRVIREEGSVGTSGFNADDGESSRLQTFFEQTSFVPFKAVADGRQKMDDIIREAPWLQLVAGTLLGFILEENILGLIDEWTRN